MDQLIPPFPSGATHQPIAADLDQFLTAVHSQAADCFSRAIAHMRGVSSPIRRWGSVATRRRTSRK
jgi:hypothetical protein